jgi:carbon monoxide dehydrogenase subunit G
MKIGGEYVFSGPREDVWELVRDPEVLSTALPGTQSLNLVGENEYEGTMNIRVGPVAGVFSGRLVVSDEVPPESCTLMVDGKGAPGFARGTGHVRLTDQGDGTTLMNRAEGREEVEYTPPSEAEFAAAVAKDMAGEVFSSPRVVWIAVAVIVIVVIVAVALISRGGV